MDLGSLVVVVWRVHPVVAAVVHQLLHQVDEKEASAEEDLPDRLLLQLREGVEALHHLGGSIQVTSVLKSAAAQNYLWQNVSEAGGEQDASAKAKQERSCLPPPAVLGRSPLEEDGDQAQSEGPQQEDEHGQDLGAREIHV